MMMRTAARSGRGLLVAAAATFAIALGGCAGGPKDAANNYLSNLKIFNYPACYAALSHKDQLDRTLEQFLSNPPMAPNVAKEWFKPVLGDMAFVPSEAKVEGEKAIVPIKVTMPDLAAWERTMYTLPTTKASTESQAQDALRDGTYPKLTYQDSMVMVKESDGWKVFVDFPAKDDIAKMHKQAVEMYHKHDYDKAIASYQALLAALDKEQASGNEGLKFLYGQELKDLQNIKAQTTDAMGYIPKLVLSDVDLKMSASRVPGIFGKITNSGDKGVDEVEMTVNYYLGKGAKKKVVFTENHTAIATPMEFTNFARPVLPLVPGEARDFGFKLTAPVDIQQKASPDLIITAVTFTQSTAPLPKPPTPTPAAKATPAAGGAPAAAASPAAPSSAPPPALPK